MHCSHNEYAPDGKPLYEIVDELASDNEVFAEKFLEGTVGPNYQKFLL